MSAKTNLNKKIADSRKLNVNSENLRLGIFKDYTSEVLVERTVYRLSIPDLNGQCLTI